MDNVTIKLLPLKLILSVLLAAITVACASTAPNLDDHFGNAVNAAKAQQTLNPEASLNQDPVAGLDGRAADATMDKYHKSFVTPPPAANVFNIGVSGGGSGSATK